MYQRILSVMILSAGVAGAQAVPQRAAIVGGGNSNAGQCTIVVTVDGNAQVDVLGADGMLRNLGGGAPQWRRFECTLAMPPNPANFQFIGVSGRGHQNLTTAPRNGGPAVVRIEDTEGGAGDYTFRLTWNNGPAGQDRNSVVTRDDRGSQGGSQADRGYQGDRANQGNRVNQGDRGSQSDRGYQADRGYQGDRANQGDRGSQNDVGIKLTVDIKATVTSKVAAAGTRTRIIETAIVRSGTTEGA